MFQILRSTGCQVDFADDVPRAAEALERTPYALAIFDAQLFDAGAGAKAMEIIPAGRSGLLLLSDELERAQLAPFLASDRMSFVVSRDNPRLARELVITANKIVSRDLFGLEKYLTWGLQPKSAELRSLEEVPLAADLVGRYAAELGMSKRVVAMARTVADELLSNAVKHAPNPGASPSAISLRYGCDGELFGIAVSDRFGTLDDETVKAYLARCFTSPTPLDGEGGAGLGMFMAFEAVRQLVFNLAPGRRTEVIGLIAVSRIADPGKSLYLFRE